MKFITFFASLVVLFFLTVSCNPKLTPTTGQNYDVAINTVYTQTEVPGQEGAQPIDYLKLKLDVNENANFKVNSILFRGKLYSAQSNPRMMKINLAGGTIDKSGEELESTEALLSYTIQGNDKKLRISNIKSKETIFLP